MNSPSPQRARNWQKRVEGLIAQHDYAAAQTQLEVMANWEGKGLRAFAEWAKERLVDVRQFQQAETTNLKATAQIIRKCLKRHEYQQALVFLESLPANELTDEFLVYRDRAQQRLDRLTELEAELENARTLGDYDGCMSICEAILEIKPAHRQAGQFYEELTTHGSRSTFRYGRKRSARRQHSSNRWVWKTILSVAIPCGLLTLGLMFLYEHLGTIEFTLEVSSSVAHPDVTVTIDDKVVMLKPGSNTLNLEPGEHTLVIRREGTEIQTTRLNVQENAENIVVLDLKDPLPDKAQDSLIASVPASPPSPPVDETPATPPATTPPVSPPSQSVGNLAPGTAAGQLWNKNGLNMNFIWCPPGTYIMGCPKSYTRRTLHRDEVQVTLSQGFWLAQYEVTQDEWTTLMKTAPWMDNGTPRMRVKTGPRVAASYCNRDEAIAFCKALTDQERSAGRLPVDWEYTLPTEAQWEYACRAGTTTRWSFGDSGLDISKYAWNAENCRLGGADYVHEVGLKLPNPWNLYDMHGNLQEIVLDYFQEELPGGTDPFVPLPGRVTFRLPARGGNFGSQVTHCSSSFYWVFHARTHDDHTGFRVALSPVRKATP